jgi:hypothetical protein
MDTIEKSISEKSKINLHDYLHALSHDPDEYVNKLGETISLLRKHRAEEDVIYSVLTQFDLQSNDIDTAVITALETFVCTREDLRYIVQNCSYISDIKFIMGQIMDNVSFSQIMTNLLYAYEDKMTNDDLLDLKEHLDMYESKTRKKLPSVMNYIERNMKLKAKKPKWVSIEEGENKSYIEKVSLGLDLDNKDIFMKQLEEESSKLNIKGDMKQMIDMFASSVSDIIDKDTSYNKSFRVWGPENRFDDRDCVANPEGKGPCRMLQCLCRDAEENEGDLPIDWFTGKCDGCNRIIQDMSHTVRYPAKAGGWKGCYCSFQCTSESSPYQMNKEDQIRLKEVQKRVIEVGIMDRSLI